MTRPVLAVVALLVLVVSNQAHAFAGMAGMPGVDRRDIANMTNPPMDGSCPTPDYMLDNRDAIGISDAQAADLRKLEFQLKRLRVLKGAGVKALELELTEMVTDPDFDTQAALDKLSEIEKARTELRSEVIKASARARDLLDAGQKENLRSLMQSRPSMLKKPGSRNKPKPGMDSEKFKERMMRQMMEENMP